VISCNRSTLSTHHSLFKVSTGQDKKGKGREGKEMKIKEREGEMQDE